MAVATEHPQNYFVHHHKTNGLLLDAMSTKTKTQIKARSQMLELALCNELPHHCLMHASQISNNLVKLWNPYDIM